MYLELHSLLLCLWLFSITHALEDQPPSGDFVSVCDKVSNNGIYDQKLKKKKIKVVCEVNKKNGNWLVIQRRSTGKVNFFRGWEHYVHGFGDLNTDFWLGLENIHQITYGMACQLRVRLQLKDGHSSVGTYNDLRISDASTNYMLSTLAVFKGGIGDGLIYHMGQPFSTYDRYNNEDNQTENCAITYQGAWWYNKCYQSNLNGRFTSEDVADEDKAKYINWTPYMTHSPIVLTEMMLRVSNSSIWDINNRRRTKSNSRLGNGLRSRRLMRNKSKLRL